MSMGRLLSPDEVHVGQLVLVVPSGPDVHRGAGLGAYSTEPAAVRVTDALHAAARRGAVHLFEALPDPIPPTTEEP